MSRVRMKQTTIAIAIMTGLGLGVMESANAAYWMNPEKTVVKNSYGECWEALGPGEDCCCDDKDSDGDGVPDSRDKCPNTPAGVKVDENGCPLDSDGDGVPDYKDKCPNTPRGTPVDADGCPTKVEKPVAAGEVIEVVVDNFDFDKSKLKPSMMNKLDDLAARINASPANEKVTIVGHTCNIGTEAYNQGLSERRARAVADYLMSKGVSRDAMAISGMGELQPAHSNKTSEGRSANRRVEVTTK